MHACAHFPKQIDIILQLITHAIYSSDGEHDGAHTSIVQQGKSQSFVCFVCLYIIIGDWVCTSLYLYGTGPAKSPFWVVFQVF